MESAGYTTLTRQTGLLRELQVVANNIANAATTGYRQEGLIFSEFVKQTEGGPSLSMARGNVRMTSMLQGPLAPTGGMLDLAIEGEGFFLIETPSGERLTRAGNFTLSAQGDLVTPDGFRVLDAGGAPVFIPPDATNIGLSPDGTLSDNGRPLAQIGLVRPVDGFAMVREDGVMFRADGEIEPVEEGHIHQGFLEGANVDPIGQVARMIEVQRAYEMGQSFLDSEHERVTSALESFIR
ncbi:flagellar hook-basal body complex protein [uncultured Roseovarius sp.]|uniref:flagellar hook-basal body complex protein n=1 Tax=uncultured Roseovarius sp. TaxID=293344 RepID=UPI000C4CD150|nr:flagellar basal-body rod protein FlgF [Roseovarius sp.]MBD12151.1 flagellar basal-body rod protein FlgF [Roseovarius sp.]HAW49026.1 flagellar basal-body rod protein FlgF [Roseovarius sp.]|tara:strand:- start:854 stop:1567 length:714 start_codon:yes stop_codon:yes gene_type:complete